VRAACKRRTRPSGQWFTDMAESGEVNVGQLARERYGESDAVLVGFGTHQGTVIAGREWGAPWEEMRVPPGRPGSWEDALHRAGGDDRMLIFDKSPSAEMSAWRGHRAIGVVYRPQYEQYGNYVPTVLPRRYDAFLFSTGRPPSARCSRPRRSWRSRRKPPRPTRPGCSRRRPGRGRAVQFFRH